MATNVRTVRLRRLQGRLGDVAYELTRIHFSDFHHPEGTWRPAVNAYRCESCIRICLELAGVEKADLDVSVEPGRLTIRGRRELASPRDEAARTLHGHGPRRHVQVLAMEIDHGPFLREIALPAEVDADRVSAEQENGLLWIHLPLRAHA